LLKCVKTYNGSRWLGCSLRVEAAKEFYLDRLQQEWQDAVCAAAHADEVKTHCCPPSLPFNKTKVALLPKNSKIRGFGFKRKPYRLPSPPLHFECVVTSGAVVAASQFPHLTFKAAMCR
jgi:hypothetical protein